MAQQNQIGRYTVGVINGVIEELRRHYDIVRIVDAEECRVVEVAPDGTIKYLEECFRIWSRGTRCENCTSYRACSTHCKVEKKEFLGDELEEIQSVPFELILSSGEIQSFVMECVRRTGQDAEGARIAYLNDKRADRSVDVLTRFVNAERLYREMRALLLANPDESYDIVFVNIHRFKLMNQIFGIDGGNRLLVAVADAIREYCPEGSVYGKYTNDRFAMLIPTDGLDTDRLAGLLRQSVRGAIDSPVYDVRVKIGILRAIDHDQPISVMIRHAELAADSIRHVPECTVAFFKPEMLERKLRSQRVITDFGSAIEGGEFRIFLQPQVKSDGRMIGAEALVRWVRPDGIVSPGDFLPVLSRTELLSRLDLCVWEQAIALLGKWKNSRLSRLFISVNVDPSDFCYIDVPVCLAELCARYGVDPAKVRVEITETALVADIERQSNIVERLHGAGFAVEIDDFGKGSSSLSFLKDIKADTLKIDMGFLRGESNLDRSRVILESVIAMAGRLGMDVITEGVETEEQVRWLTDIGCPNFQGFYFSRPVPIVDFEAAALAQN